MKKPFTMTTAVIAFLAVFDVTESSRKVTFSHDQKYILVEHIGEPNLDWMTAEQLCIDEFHGHLASIHSEAENAAIDALLDGAGITGHAWVGFNDRANEGQWVWSDGTPTDYTKWGGGEPNNCCEATYPGGEDCLHLNFRSNGEWNDIWCTHAGTQSYVCGNGDKFAEYCDDDSCDACWPDEEGVVVEDACIEVASVDGICKDEYVARRCPTECGYCSADMDGNYHFCADTGSWSASPLHGPDCGGQYVLVSSDCWDNDMYPEFDPKVACLFGYSYVEGVRWNATHYLCVAPPRRPRNGPLEVDFRVKIGHKYMANMGVFVYEEICLGKIAGAESDLSAYMGVGEERVFEWDETLIYTDRVVLYWDRYFSDAAAGNWNREILKITKNDGKTTYTVPDTYPNNNGNEMMQARISVAPLSDALAEREANGEPISIQNNMRAAWADHADIRSSGIAHDLHVSMQAGRVAAGAVLGVNERNPKWAAGKGGSAETYAICVSSCQVALKHGGAVADAMKEVYINYLPCGAHRDWASFNMDIGADIGEMEDVLDKDECLVQCEAKLDSNAFCFLSPANTCPWDTHLDLNDDEWGNSTCVQWFEDVYGNDVDEQWHPSSACIKDLKLGQICPCDAPNGDGGGGDGDPHWRTWDSHGAYLHHYQGAGVFTAIKGPYLGFEGQVLTRRKQTSSTVSYTYGMAWVKDGHDPISVEYEDNGNWIVWYGDTQIDVNDPDQVEQLNTDADYFDFTWTGRSVEILFDFGIWASYTSYLQFLVRPNCVLKGELMGGLLGTYNGDSTDDLINHDYVTYQPVSEYPTWGHQWRVHCDDSLFPGYTHGSACNNGNAYGDRRRLQEEGDECNPEDLFVVCDLPADFEFDPEKFDRSVYSKREKDRAEELCDAWDRDDMGIQQCWIDFLTSTDEEAAVLVKDAIKEFEAKVNPPEDEYVCIPVCMNGGICVDNGVCQCMGPWQGPFCGDPDREWNPTEMPTLSPSRNPTMSPTRNPTPDWCRNYPETCSDGLCYNGRNSGAKSCSAEGFVVDPTGCGDICSTVECRHCGDVAKCMKTCRNFKKVNGIAVEKTFSCTDECNAPGVDYVCFEDCGTMECPQECKRRTCRGLDQPHKMECSSYDKMVDPLGCMEHDPCRIATCDECGTTRECIAMCLEFQLDHPRHSLIQGIDCDAECRAIDRYKCFATCVPPDVDPEEPEEPAP